MNQGSLYSTVAVPYVFISRTKPISDIVTVGIFDLNEHAREKARDFRIKRYVRPDDFEHIKSPFR